MSWWTTVGFVLSFYIFHDYSSSKSQGSNEKKYMSYVVLRDSVIPAIKTGEGEFIKKTTSQYFEQVRKEIFKPY